MPLVRPLIKRALGSLCLALTLSLQSHGASVLVSDTNNQQVRRYAVAGNTWTPNGVFASGSYGGVALASPFGMARDAVGNVYIGEERDGGRILKFNSDGVFVEVVVTEGASFAGRPEALAFGPDGKLYLSTAFGTVSDRVYRIDPSDKSVTIFVPTTGTGYTLNNPRGIAFGSDGNLYVADRNAALNGNAATDAIRVFDGTSGAFIRNLATPDNPQGLSFDAANERLLVSVFGNADILQLTLDGTQTKIYDQNAAKSFLDIKSIEGQIYFTRFEDGRVDRLTGLTTSEAAVSGLNGPGHLLVLSEEPVPPVVPPVACLDLVPGVVVKHFPASSGTYIGSPSIAILPNGDYVASHDTFGPASSKDRTYLYRSTDRGQNWTALTQVTGQYWSTLFVNQAELHLIGTSREYGQTVIRKSTDGGATWTAATAILSDTPYHCAPVPVLVHNGRVWRAMEDAMAPGGWPRHFRAFMMSAPIDADLLNAANWTISNRLQSNDTWLGAGVFNGWLEGNAVATPGGQIVDILRADVSTPAEKAAIVTISADGTTATFNPATGFVNFPGGAKKFTIRYDAQSGYYWSLANYVPPQHQGNSPGSVRNTLALIRSPDLTNWTVQTILLYSPDVPKTGFQYVDWLFDGADMVAVSRTAFDDGLGGANDYHNANFLTFHRFANFRDLTAANSVGFGGITQELAGATIQGTGFEIGRFDLGELAFTNRTYTWQGLPAAFRGWQFTRTGGNLRAGITVTAKAAGFIYGTTAPSLPGVDLTGWEIVPGATFSYSDAGNTQMQIYRRSVTAGQVLEIPQGNFTGMIVLSPDPLGLLAWWRFDNACGLTVRDSAHHVDGLRSSSGTAIVDGGVSGSALSLNALQDGYVSFGNRYTLASGDFSIVAWVKMNANDATPASYILSKYSNLGTAGYFLSVNPTQSLGAAGKAVFYAGAATGSPVSVTNINDGRWHQVVSVFQTSGNKSLYVDGASVESASAAQPIQASADLLLLGGAMINGSPKGGFTGLLDEVQIYDRALSDAEIDYLFRHPGQSARPGSVLPIGVPASITGASAAGHFTPTVSWPSLHGYTYQVFRKLSLLEAQWTLVASPTATGPHTNYTDPTNPLPAAFYYVDIVP